MAARSRRPDAAEVGHQTWNHLRVRAEKRPGEFTPVTRDNAAGWLWDGALSSLIREAIPGIADSDLRRAREYLNASGMITNLGGGQHGAGQPQWFIRGDWHQGPGGHVHVVSAHQRDLPDAPLPHQPAAGDGPEEQLLRPGPDLTEALQPLIRQVSDLQADNDRLRGDNERLCAQIGRLRALMHQAGREIRRQAGELLADTED
jgi:hypothetical protein